MSKKLAAIAALGAVLMTVGCASGAVASAKTPSPTPTQVQTLADKVRAVAKECNVQDATGTGLSTSDQGRTVMLTTAATNNSYMGISMGDAQCILVDLGVPGSILGEISHTSSLDGRQAESWNGVKLSWTYHPDNGLNLIMSSGPSAVVSDSATS